MWRPRFFVDKHTVVAARNDPRVVASRALPPRGGGRAHPRNGCMPARVRRRRGPWIRLRSPRRARAAGSGARAGSRPRLRGPERISVGQVSKPRPQRVVSSGELSRGREGVKALSPEL